MARACDVAPWSAAAPGRVTVLDPVDVVTGEVLESRTDFTLPGPVPFAWTAHYSNQLGVAGSLGWNWTHAYDARLALRSGTAVYATGLGSEVLFPEVPEMRARVVSADGRFTLDRVDDVTLVVTLPDALRRVFRIDDASETALQAVIDRNGHRVDFTYEAGRLTRIRDSAGRVLELMLDAYSRIERIRCFRGNDAPGIVTLVSYAYDERGDLVGVTDAAGATRHYAYDAGHQLVRRTDRNGYSFHYDYDGARCRRTAGDDGLYSGELEYDTPARRTRVRGFDGRVTEYRYDDHARVTREIDPAGNVTETVYDPAGNVALRTDRVGRATVWKYDERGRLLEEAHATGHRVTYTYDADGNLTTRDDSTAGVTRYAHDERGNVTHESGPAGTTENRYDRYGRLRWSKANGSLPETFHYDTHHQLVAIRGVAAQVVIAYEYDLLGNITASIDRHGRIEYAYDAMSRMTRVRYPDGTFEESAFDPEGNPIRWRERFGAVWHYRYQARKQLTEVVAPDGGVTRYEYTRADELAAVTDPAGNRTDYVRDVRDFVTAVRRNGAVIDQYERDPEGRLVTKRDAHGSVLLSLQYDAAQEPTRRRHFRDGRLVERAITLDARGRVVGATDGVQELTRAFDTTGHVVAEARGEHGVAQQMDRDGGLARADFNGGLEFRQHVTNGTRVIRDPKGRRHAQRMSGSLVSENVFASGIREQFTYDEWGRVETHVIRRNGLVLSRATYRRDVNGQLLGERTPTGEVRFEYDACRRLTAILARAGGSPPFESERFAYDPAGNVHGVNGREAAYITGNLLAGAADRRFEYDDRGRLVRDRGPDRERSYRYDSLDQMVAAEDNGRVTAEYDYDALRRRIRKSTSEGVTSFGWNGSRVAWEVRPDGSRRIYHYSDATTHDPLFVCDEQIGADDNPIRRIYAVHHDPSHRPVLVTDESGDVVWSATWSAYGEATIAARGDFEYALRLPGQYFDRETGLHYNYHRHYDPTIGRFIQPDPIGLAGGLNLYEYSGGDPLRGCEVLGLTGT
jgi:RHS repeat-associated protein